MNDEMLTGREGEDMEMLTQSWAGSTMNTLFGIRGRGQRSESEKYSQ
jgi:hypothetical protein